MNQTKPWHMVFAAIFILVGMPVSSHAQNAGDLYATDPIVGNLRYVPAGSFTQGSPVTEPCRESGDPGDETQFTHYLTKDIAVMETEVTRQMWADLQAVQATLPIDPTDTLYGSGMTNPAQNITWYESVLFANLLSIQQGLTGCYYNDVGFTIPIDATNYQTDAVYCNWNANGYRLPSEGEWEYFCRAGTATPFWIDEPSYTSGNCGLASTSGMYPQLETAAWFWGNSSGINTSSPVGQKAANPWNLLDVHGSVWEWCWDWYSTAYPSGAQSDYRGPSSGSLRAIRGGSWGNYALNCRSAIRLGRNTTGPRSFYFGFRLLRSLPVSSVRITNIKSKTWRAGSAATIYGTGFSTDKRKDTVYFGTKKARVKKAKTTSLSIKIPAGPNGTMDAYVVVNGEKSNTWPVTVR